MINLGLSVRRAVLEDHQQIAGLLFHETNIHRHLDWRSPLGWLGSANFWVLEEGGRVLAAMACPQDPPLVSWIRVFGYLPHLSGAEAWNTLWDAASADMAGSRGAQVAAIVVKQWFQTILLHSGFTPRQSITLLELRGEYFARSFPVPKGLRIRGMLEEDLQAVADLDLQAFGPFWHNTRSALDRARLQAVYASVAEDSSGVIGYQLSTGNPFGAHLARLGVRKEAQGRGIGAALVSDLVDHLGPIHLSRISVNTQSDNEASLALYKKLGFIRTGEQYPVLAYEID